MTDALFETWIADLERRHLAELSFPEVRKGLQALSSLYVERRGRLGAGAVFDGAGKRAAFALFFGPLHFLVVREIVAAVGAAEPAPVARSWTWAAGPARRARRGPWRRAPPPRFGARSGAAGPCGRQGRPAGLSASAAGPRRATSSASGSRAPERESSSAGSSTS